MELYQLRSFAAVAELGHLTRAADRLHVSQPALSAQIKALEEELGLALFERLPTGMELTDAGRQLLPEAIRVVAAAKSLRGHAEALKGDVSGRVRVGTLSDPEFIRLSALLARATDRFPLLEIELHQAFSGEAFAKVQEGELDASFYYGDHAHQAVTCIPLRKFAYRVAVPDEWKDEVKGGFPAIAALPWVSAPAISTLREMAEGLFQKHNVAPERIIEADNEPVIRSLIVSGIGAGLMREDVAKESEAAGEIVLLPGIRLVTALQFIFRTEREDDIGVQALRDLVGEVWDLADREPAASTASGAHA